MSHDGYVQGFVHMPATWQLESAGVRSKAQAADIIKNPLDFSAFSEERRESYHRCYDYVYDDNITPGVKHSLEQLLSQTKIKGRTEMKGRLYASTAERYQETLDALMGINQFSIFNTEVTRSDGSKHAGFKLVVHPDLLEAAQKAISPSAAR